MDTLTRYREIVERVLTEYGRIPFAHGVIHTQTIFDRESDHYLLMLLGHEGPRRVHGCLVHIDIKDGKIWIQRDGTERGITRELLAAGVPGKDILLAFHLPDPPEPVPVAAE